LNLKSIIQFSIGPLGVAFFGFITIPILTWVFQPEDIGKFTMLQLTSTLFILIFSLGLDQAYIREHYESENKAQLIKTSILPGLFLLLLFFSFFVFFPKLISVILFNISSQILSVLVITYIIFAFLSRFLSLILRMEEKGLAYSASQIFPKILFLLVILYYYFYYTKYNLTDLIFAHTLSVILVFFVFLWNTKSVWKSSFNQKIDRKKLKAMLHYGIPLTFGGIAYWGLTAIDKIFLRYFSNYEQLGLYSVSVNFAGAALILQTIFSTIWAPTVFKWANSEDGFIKINKVREYLLLGVIFIFLISGTFSWLIDFILPKNYLDVKYILLSCLCYPLLYTISETTVIGINIVKKTSYSMIASLISFIFNLIFCYLLIPNYGAIGAGISTSFSFLIFLILRTEFSNFLWKKTPRLKIYTTGLFMVLTSSLIVFNKDLMNWSLHIFFGVLLALFSIYTYKKIPDIKNSMNKVRS